MLRYAWLDHIEILNKPFLPVDYREASAGIEIADIVFVQADCAAHQALDEVEWIASLDAPIQAIIAFAPLETGDSVRPYLEKLKEYPRIKGVRRLIQSEEHGFSLQPSFVKSVQALADYQFSFEICVYHHQLPDIISLVTQCPNVEFVLNHGGKPNIAEKSIESWRKDIMGAISASLGLVRRLKPKPTPNRLH